MKKVFLFCVVLSIMCAGSSWSEIRTTSCPNGTFKSNVDLKNGVPAGTGKIYSEDGVLLQETFYVKGKTEQAIKIYYKSGQLFQEAHLLNNKVVGDWKFYTPKGALMHKLSFKRDGNMISEAYYDEQDKLIKDGEWKGYDQEGNVTGPFRLKNGVREDGQ